MENTATLSNPRELILQIAKKKDHISFLHISPKIPLILHEEQYYLVLG